MAISDNLNRVSGLFSTNTGDNTTGGGGAPKTNQNAQTGKTSRNELSPYIDNAPGKSPVYNPPQDPKSTYDASPDLRYLSQMLGQSNVGTPTNKDFFPGGEVDVRAGQYQGKKIGSVPIFSGAGTLTPFAALAKREERLRDRMYNAMKKQLQPLDFTVPETTPIYQEKVNDYVIKGLDYFNNVANSLGPHGWDMIRSGKSRHSEDYWRFQENAKTLARQYDTIFESAANLSKQEGKYYVPKQAAKTMNEVLGGMLDIENGRLTPKNMGKLVTRMRTYSSIQSMLQGKWGNIQQKLDTRIRSAYDHEFRNTPEEKRPDYYDYFVKESKKYLGKDQADAIANSISMDFPMSVYNPKRDDSQGNKPFTVDDISNYVQSFFEGQVDLQYSIQQPRKSDNININMDTNKVDAVPSFINNTLESLNKGDDINFGDNRVVSGKAGITGYIDGEKTFAPYYDTKSVARILLQASSGDGSIWGASSTHSVASAMQNLENNPAILENIKKKYWENKNKDEWKTQVDTPAQTVPEMIDRSINLAGGIPISGGKNQIEVTGVEASKREFSYKDDSGEKKRTQQFDDSMFRIKANVNGIEQKGIIIPNVFTEDDLGEINLEGKDVDLVPLAGNYYFIPGYFFKRDSYGEGEDPDEDKTYVIARSDGKKLKNIKSDDLDEIGTKISDVEFPYTSIKAPFENHYNEIKDKIYSGGSLTVGSNIQYGQNISGRYQYNARSIGDLGKRMTMIEELYGSDQSSIESYHNVNLTNLAKDEDFMRSVSTLRQRARDILEREPTEEEVRVVMRDYLEKYIENRK